MSSKTEKLTPFSYVVLVLVGEGGAGPHDLARMMRDGRIFWAAAESHYYSEAKRLEKLGHLRSRKEPGRTRERTVYALTQKGRRAVASWLREPSAFVRVQNEPAVRLLASDLAADPADVRNSLEAVRGEIADQTDALDRRAEAFSSIPHRAVPLRLNDRLNRRILEAFSEWLDEVERELG